MQVCYTSLPSTTEILMRQGPILQFQKLEKAHDESTRTLLVLSSSISVCTRGNIEYLLL